ncbi:MAG: hypothetical protein LUH22_03170 [Bacteroides sp.]|nr:hypothetical protein [Bacteroides sp.]
MKKRNKPLHYQARRAALEVDFIETGSEIIFYTNALYDAMLWGKETTPPRLLKESNSGFLLCL